MNLKQKTVNSLIWSFIDSFAGQGIQFVVGLILARILMPHDFGLIGMLTIFIAISQSFVDSGFSQALIRKQNCSTTDYATVFYFNLFVSLLLYFVLFVTSRPISLFFEEPQLKSLIKILALSIIFDSFAIIQRTILIKELNFKLQTKISFIASSGSGIIAIAMAFKGFGVWSLVALTLGRFGLTSLFFWIWSSWKPLWKFSKESFKELFSFGGRLLVSGLIDTAYKHIYYFIIGKYFSAVELGYYTRADQFKIIPSQSITGIISKVSYPVLSSIQDDPIQLKAGYKRLIKSTMLITFVLMLGLVAIAKSMIITLIGDKWIPSIIYLQMLCFVGMFYPLHALNLNILKIQGRSDLYLRLEIIKKTMAIPIIIIGIIFGIKIMITGMIVSSIIAYYLNSYWSGKFINYPPSEQIKDIIPGFLLAVVVNVLVFLAGILIVTSPIILFFIQISLGAILTIGICEFIKIKDYLYIKEIIIEKFIKRKI